MDADRDSFVPEITKPNREEKVENKPVNEPVPVIESQNATILVAECPVARNSENENLGTPLEEVTNKFETVEENPPTNGIATKSETLIESEKGLVENATKLSETKPDEQSVSNLNTRRIFCVAFGSSRETGTAISHERDVALRLP